MGLIINDHEKRWNGGIVPFEIDNTDFPAGSTNRQRIDDAIQQWNLTSAGTMLFVERDGDADFVRFNTHTDKCRSQVGRQGGMQHIRCDLGDFSTGNILHEMCHAVGMFHEHQRNPFHPGWSIEILRDNIDDNHDQFEMKSGSQATGLGEHDYRSIMHYSATANAKTDSSGSRLTTIQTGLRLPQQIPLLHPVDKPIGQRVALSDGDIATLRQLAREG